MHLKYHIAVAGTFLEIGKYDKIEISAIASFQVNGHDFTVVTHRKAVEYIQRKPVLNMLVYRKGVPAIASGDGQPQFQSYSQDNYSMQYQPNARLS